jgi:hypothetical protein
MRGIAARGLPVRVGFGAVLLLGLFAWAPATYPGYWQALEGFIPIFNVTRTGALATVAATPDLWRGIGGATFLLSRPFILFGSEPTVAVRIGFILSFLLGALGCYSWLQGRLGDRAAGLAGVIYLFAPPLLATVYIRGSLSDATIVALLPLALAGLAAYHQTRAISAAGIAVIATLWMWQTQAGLALFATVLLLAYALLVERSWLVALIVGVSGAAGLTSLAAIWETSAPSPVVFADHFVYFFQFFQQTWQQAPSIAGWQDGYPFQLGLVALLYTVLYGVLAFSKHGRQSTATKPIVRRLWLFSVGAILLLTVATLPISAPFWQWSGADRLLTYPWQLLLLTLPLWAMAAGALPTVHPLFRQTPLWIVLLVVVVLNSYPYLTADYTQVAAPATPVAIFGSQSEIVILAASLTENRQPRITELALTWQALRPLPFDYNVFFQALRIDQDNQQSSRSPETPSTPLSSPGTTDQTLTIVRQLDRQPLDAAQPATRWQPGEIFTTTYVLDLAELPDDAALVYYFGYYDWRDGSRLPVNLGIDDKLIVYGH